MANVTIFPEQEISSFYWSEEFQCYRYNLNPSPFTLLLDVIHIVYWDNNVYECKVIDLNSMQEGTLGIGNFSSIGIESEDVPFAIGWAEQGVSFFSFEEQSDEQINHTVRIQQVEEIILKDLNGVENKYQNVDVVELNNNRNGTTLFNRGKISENFIVESLDFSDGNQLVTVPEYELLKQFTITKPENLIPENIANGIEIGGVIGEYVGTQNAPKLYAPTMTITDGGVTDKINVTNPSSNGQFAENIDIYLNGELRTSATTSAGSTKTWDANNLFNGIEGKQTIGASLRAESFRNSDIVESEIEMYSVTVTPDHENYDDGYDYPSIKAGATYTGNFSFKAGLGMEEGRFLPPVPNITMGGQECEYSWNNDVGMATPSPGSTEGLTCLSRCEAGSLVVENVTGPLKIDIVNFLNPKLNPPTIRQLTDNTITFTPSPYTEKIKIYVDGELWTEIQGATYTTESIAKYKYSSNNDVTASFGVHHGAYGFLLPSPPNISGYSIGKITFTVPEDMTITLRCGYDIYNTNGSNYGFLGNLDTTLASSNTIDSSSKIKKSFYGLASKTLTRAVSYDIPQGEHFIYAKFVEISTPYSAASFGCMPYILCPEKTFNLSEILSDNNVHTISAIAQASNSIDSDLASIECQLV